MDFILEPSDIGWVQETITKASEELRQITLNGKAFTDAVNVIVEREKNWVIFFFFFFFLCNLNGIDIKGYKRQHVAKPKM
jgi:hypothetical protein